MTKTVGDAVASQVRRYRGELGWSVRQLADECQRLGAPKLTTASIVNVERTSRGERKRRDVTVDEVFVLAYALGVPPLLLMIPLGKNEPLQITTTAAVHPHLAWDAATGRGFLVADGNVATRPEDNFKGRVIVSLFDTLRAAQDAYSRAEARLRMAEDDGSADEVARATGQLAAAVDPFAQAVENLMRHGQEVPAYRPETVAALRRTGILTTPDRLEIFEPTAEGSDRG